MEGTNQTVLVLDFGGQYKELIARRVRECKVYSRIEPGNIPVSRIKKIAPVGIILTGGPNSVNDPDSPKCPRELFSLGIPVLGICYGMQAMCHALGGKVEHCDPGEYGRTAAVLNNDCPLFDGLSAEQTVLMSHTDAVVRLPRGFEIMGKTVGCPNAAAGNVSLRLYCVQFHPEVESTPNGTQIIHNFLYNVCGAAGDYDMSDYEEKQIRAIRERVGNDRVILGLSGGVDSSVCAALLAKAIPGQLYCIFVDHGLMRKNEGDEVEAAFKKHALNFIRINAQDEFLAALKGVTEPEAKRKIIGKLFIDVFRRAAANIGGVRFLAQGTIYPDVIESGAWNSAVIKSHHNVGGLPEELGFDGGLIEPLRGLFKDEVRVLGRRLKLPKPLVQRQPFPGPGLAVRVIGEVTKEKLEVLREADYIFRTELQRTRCHASQFFAVLTDMRSVGVVGDFRTYDYTVALRAVVTGDFMTAEFAEIPYRVLSRVSSRIVNEVAGVGRVVYDITGKPPATIEWE